jgi:hypothetical protein
MSWGFLRKVISLGFLNSTRGLPQAFIVSK